MNPNRQLNPRFLSFIFLLLTVVANTAFGQDTNLLEEFVRSADREVVLKKLVPGTCLLYTSPSPRDLSTSRMPSSA